MHHLWAAWRLAYVSGGSESNGCVFCPSTREDSDARSGQAPSTREDSDALSGHASGDSFESLVVFRGTTCFVILNLFPYNNGHLMVVPNRHIGALADATPEELAELIELARRAEIAITEAYAPHGMNLGINLGKPAGAGVPGHLHLHVVPRWSGDTNFMTVVGQTRVLPEELAQTAERLRPIFLRLEPGR